METNGLPGIPLKFRGIHDNLSSPDEVLFWTLVADKDIILSAVLTGSFSIWLCVLTFEQSTQVRTPQMGGGGVPGDACVYA